MTEKQPSKTSTQKGIECPRCGCRHFYVIYTRPRDGKIVRRKECRHCQRRVTTSESVVGSQEPCPTEPPKPIVYPDQQ